MKHISRSWGCSSAARVAISIVAGVAAVAAAPIAHAEEGVTYEIFSDNVGILAGVEYRDTTGKHLLQDVPLPWSLTVPVADPASPTDAGAELRADWRPDFRTAWTVGGVLRGQFVTVRISMNGKVLCENRLDVGNATCYGSVPHDESDSSYDRSPRNREQPGFSP